MKDMIYTFFIQLVKSHFKCYNRLNFNKNRLFMSGTEGVYVMDGVFVPHFSCHMYIYDDDIYDLDEYQGEGIV